jgi:hypothetical protein
MPRILVGLQAQRNPAFIRQFLCSERKQQLFHEISSINEPLYVGRVRFAVTKTEYLTIIQVNFTPRIFNHNMSFHCRYKIRESGLYCIV